jgi:hypothetical protein
MKNFHSKIYKKLDYFHKKEDIPHILFHGDYGSGKKTILIDFLNKIYNNNITPSYVMYVNCSRFKGIKFIREDLKFFAKSKIDTKNGTQFKSIVLTNANNLTIDAQSALRRCIELFSESTRFFIIVNNKNGLLKPILSRFCEIYVENPILNNKLVNLYQYNLQQSFPFESLYKTRMNYIKNTFSTTKDMTPLQLFNRAELLYKKGYSALDLINYLSNSIELSLDKCKFIFLFNKFRLEIRNEVLLMYIILHFLSYNLDLENIPFM